MSEIKPGTLCWLRQTPAYHVYPDNIGKIVVAVRRQPSDRNDGSTWWVVECETGLLSVKRGNGTTRQSWGYAFTETLVPINDPDMEVEDATRHDIPESII